jgi:hypothetical protein
MNELQGLSEHSDEAEAAADSHWIVTALGLGIDGNLRLLYSNDGVMVHGAKRGRLMPQIEVEVCCL